MTSERASALEDLQNYVDQIPFAKQFDLKVSTAAPGSVSIVLKPQPQLFNHFETYQAGVYYTLSEITGGVLCGTFIDLSSNLLLTRSSTIKFLKGAGTAITASASLNEADRLRVLEVLEAKRKTILNVGVSIRDESEALVASGTNEYYLRNSIPKRFGRIS